MIRPTRHPLQSILSLSIVLLAFGLRLWDLTAVPPGWRDDELINIYALSGELFEGRFPLYFTGASGHEPLYHYLQAGFNALLGYNVLSGHLLSAVLGTLTIPLTFALVRRLFGSLIAALTALALTFSFWSLMYSRIALRHINLPPFALVAVFLLWTPLVSRRRRTARWAVPLGLVLGLSLYIYPAARVLPFILAAFIFYLALFHRDEFRHVWAGYALALVTTAVVAIPLAVAIAQGSSEAAAHGIGADARLIELARPIQALREGDPRPLLENTWTTLGMFHTTGDPEWLYNIPNRPVFNLLGGALLWAGVLLCLYRWRQPRYFFLLLWFGFGLSPTVLSVPAASLSHSILIQPLAYLFPVLIVVEIHKWFTSRALRPGCFAGAHVLARHGLPIALLLFLCSTAFRDLRDYFFAWPQEEMVRFLYRADYRKAAQYLDDHPQIVDVAVGSTLFGPWDRLALDDDLEREDLQVRLFNPERSLVLLADSSSPGHIDVEAAILVTTFPSLDQGMVGLLEGPQVWGEMGLQRYHPPGALPSPDIRPPSRALFENGLELVGATWREGTPGPGQDGTLWLTWQVAQPLDLPPIPIVANPPPAGVYNGPRLAVFTHLLAADGTFLVGDDGLWVDPVTLLPGDRFLQIHHLPLPPDASSGPYTLEVGLYDPLTKERWVVLGEGERPTVDHLLLPTE